VNTVYAFLNISTEFYHEFHTADTHTTILRVTALFRDYLGEPVPDEFSSGLYGAREDNRGRHTNNPDGRHSIQTNQRPTTNITPFLYHMPFLPQPSWLAYPVSTTNFTILKYRNQ